MADTGNEHPSPPVRGVGRNNLTTLEPMLEDVAPLAAPWVQAPIGNFPPIAIPASPVPPAAGMAGGRFWGSLAAKRQDGAREHFRWVQ